MEGRALVVEAASVVGLILIGLTLLTVFIGGLEWLLEEITAIASARWRQTALTVGAVTYLLAGYGLGWALYHWNWL